MGPSVTEDAREFIYRLDPSDRITFVNEAWGLFATENEAADLASAEVVGRSLWDFIANPEVRHLYEVVFRKVRATRKRVTIPFRCDSPTRRRYMQLTVSPLVGDALEIAGRMVREEVRSQIALWNPAAPRSDSTLTVCSWCKSVQLTDTQWVEVEVALDVLGTLLGPTLPQLAHGVCPACRSELLA